MASSTLAVSVALTSAALLSLAIFKLRSKGLWSIFSARSSKLKCRPHPHWIPGTPQPPPFSESDVIHIKIADLDASALYPLTISAIVPRPIAFISSQSGDGVGNLSPYSYFNTVSHDPPVLAIGHCWSKGKPKDSLRNILETKEFVVSIISEWFIESANHTCGAYPPDLNEMVLARLTPVPSVLVAPPRVGESAINMECKLIHSYDIKNANGVITSTVILGEVLMFHIAKHVASESPNSKKVIIDPVKLKAIARLGGNIYGQIDSFFEIPRPDGQGKYPDEDSFSASDRDNILRQNK